MWMTGPWARRQCWFHRRRLMRSRSPAVASVCDRDRLSTPRPMPPLSSHHLGESSSEPTRCCGVGFASGHHHPPSPPCLAGQRLRARPRPGCAFSFSAGDLSKTRRECHYTRELDLETLVWTRGKNFPLSSLDGRLMCPRCRSRLVVVLFQPPTVSKSVRG